MTGVTESQRMKRNLKTQRSYNDTSSQNLACAFACAVTVHSQQTTDWVARNGRYSIFSTLRRIVPQVTAPENNTRRRVNKLSGSQFNKILQAQYGFICARTRIRNLTGTAGNWLFRNRRWLDPQDAHDRKVLDSNYEMLHNLSPHFKSCSKHFFMECLRDVCAAWSSLHAATWASHGGGIIDGSFHLEQYQKHHCSSCVTISHKLAEVRLVVQDDGSAYSEDELPHHAHSSSYGLLVGWSGQIPVPSVQPPLWCTDLQLEHKDPEYDLPHISTLVSTPSCRATFAAAVDSLNAGDAVDMILHMLDTEHNIPGFDTHLNDSIASSPSRIGQKQGWQNREPANFASPL